MTKTQQINTLTQIKLKTNYNNKVYSSICLHFYENKYKSFS